MSGQSGEIMSGYRGNGVCKTDLHKTCKVSTWCVVLLLLSFVIEGRTQRSVVAKLYHSIRDEKGVLVCADSTPNKTIKGVPSAITCSGYCTMVPECQHFNQLSRNRVCQLFYFEPSLSQYGVQDNCIHYSITTRLTTLAATTAVPTTIRLTTPTVTTTITTTIKPTTLAATTTIPTTIKPTTLAATTTIPTTIKQTTLAATTIQTTVSTKIPYPTNAVNLALGRPAWSSSVFSYNSPPYVIDCTADKAVDGNNDTEIWDNSCQATTDDPGGPNWLMVDMGGLVRLNYVVLTNRNDAAAANRLDYFIVGVTNTSAAIAAPVRGSYPLCGQYPTTALASARLTLFCTASTPLARYVIVQQPSTGPGWLTVCELEIYT